LAKAKGIRISDLAKELGIPAKAILEKIHAEGIESDKELKSSSSIPLGLAETVRDWKTTGELKSAEESSVAVAEKERPKRFAPKKKRADGEEGPHEPGNGEHDEQAEHDEPAPTAPAPVAPVVAEVPQPAPEPHIESIPVLPPITPAAAVEPTIAPTHAGPPVTPAPHTTPATPVVAPLKPAATQEVQKMVATPPAPVLETPKPAIPSPATLRPAAQPLRPAASTGGTATPHAPGMPGQAGPGGIRGHMPRPTVKLDSMPTREAVTPAPRLVTPTKAVVKGPALIREEKPDVVSAPRPRGPRAPAGSNEGSTSFRPPLSRGGAGVRVSEDAEGEEEKKKAAARPAAVRRKGIDGRRGLAEEKLKEFTDADLIERADRLKEAARYRTGVDLHMRKNTPGQRGPAQSPQQRGGPTEIEEPITVKSLSSVIGVKSGEILKSLIKQGIFATQNQTLAFDTAGALALAFGVELQIKKAPTLEEQFMAEFDARPRDEANLVLRPPVVTIMGHVDHGKTSLLDKIRSANVAAGEAGGITQHIAAFSVDVAREIGDRKRVTFIDTPGHEAFAAMRARGANMTDVVVLVIDAAQGVQPRTIESINHARAAGVPIVVAMNKIDLPDANPDMVMGQLAQQELNPVVWGGQTEVVQTSGKTGQGIDELIEILDLQSQILELKADPTAPARGIVIEARMDAGMGPVATVLVQDGTLKVGDVVLAGQGYGRIRQIKDSAGKFIQEAGPSMPVLIAGLSMVPSAGDKFFVTDDMDRAEQIATERHTQQRSQMVAQSRVSLTNLFATIKEGDIKTINLILKADVQGSIETLQKTVTDYNTGEVQVKVIHAAVGPINESDVDLASASNAVIIGFHVVAEPAAATLAEARRIEIRTYRVIYEIFDDLKKALSGMLEPEIREKHHGWIEVRQIFKVSRIGNIAGCYVTEGHIQRGSKIRLVRDDRVITEGVAIETLRRVKEDVKEVKTGFECGIKLAGYDDIKIGDKFEAYTREEIKRVL
jgi:translation initiation factor IF-2